MSNAIGRAALLFTSSTQQAEQGMDALYGKMQGLRGRIQGSFQNLNFSSGLGPVSAILGPVSAGFLAVAGGAKLFGEALGRVKELSDIGIKANSLGVATEQYMGLAAAAKKAGVEGNEFGTLLQKSSAKIAAGGADVQGVLKAIGLDVKQLQAMSPDKQFLAIATAIKGVDGAGAQSAAAMKLFEEQGLKLLPMLQKGGAELQAFVQKQIDSGNALGGSEISAAMRAQAAIPKVQAAFDGLWNRIVIGLAPVIETIAGVFTKILAFAQPVFDWLGRAGQAWFGVIGPVVGEIIGLFGELAAAAWEWISGLTDFGGSTFPTIGQVITDIFRMIGKAGAYAWDVIKAGAGLVVAGVGGIITVFGHIAQALTDLIKLGGELPDSLGGDVFRDAAAGAQSITDGIKSAGQTAMEWGTKQLTNFGKSADAVDQWFDKLEAKKTELLDDVEMNAAGAIDLATPAAAKGGGNAKNDAVEVGSTAAVSATARLAQGSEAALQVARNHLEEAKKTNTTLKTLAAKPTVTIGAV